MKLWSYLHTEKKQKKYVIFAISAENETNTASRPSGRMDFDEVINMENLNLTMVGEFLPPKPKKDRTEYFKEYNNRPEIKEQRKLARLEKEQQKQAQKEARAKEIQENNAKLYEAHSIQILMNLKEYTELSPAKQKLWLDFIWTFKDLNRKDGIYNLIQIMKIEQTASTLIKDFWKTAKAEKQVANTWNTLTEEKQAKLIKYLAREKVHQEQELANKLAEQEQKAKAFEPEIELAKFHEERGKIKCQCWKCEERKRIQDQIMNELFEEDKEEQLECSDCGKIVKELDEENDICKSCMRNYGGGV